VGGHQGLLVLGYVSMVAAIDSAGIGYVSMMALGYVPMWQWHWGMCLCGNAIGVCVNGGNAIGVCVNGGNAIGVCVNGGNAIGVCVNGGNAIGV